MKLVSASRILLQCTHLIRLVYHLKDRYCSEGARQVADGICSQFISSLELVSKLPQQTIEAYLTMIVDLEADSNTSSAQRASSIPTVLSRLSDE